MSSTWLLCSVMANRNVCSIAITEKKDSQILSDCSACFQIRDEECDVTICNDINSHMARDLIGSAYSYRDVYLHLVSYSQTRFFPFSWGQGKERVWSNLHERFVSPGPGFLTDRKGCGYMNLSLAKEKYVWSQLAQCSFSF